MKTKYFTFLAVIILATLTVAAISSSAITAPPDPTKPQKVHEVWVTPTQSVNGIQFKTFVIKVGNHFYLCTGYSTINTMIHYEDCRCKIGK